MSEYKRNYWKDEDEGGNIPDDAPAISAENLNNMEAGIELAISKANEAKVHADTNILFYRGKGQCEHDKYANILQIPKMEDLKNYVLLIQLWASSNYGVHFAFVPFDEEICVYEPGSNRIYVRASSDTGIISCMNELGSYNYNIIAMLIPATQTITNV